MDRMEIAKAVRPVFDGTRVGREDLQRAANAGQARPEVVELLGELPECSLLRITELWPLLPELPVKREETAQ